MPTIVDIKEQEVVDTPVLLFDCVLADGSIERWSTHALSVSGNDYDARVLAHNLFEFRQSSDDMADGTARLSLRLANADSYFSQLEQTRGLKGSKLTVRFAFFNLVTGTMSSEERMVFRGSCTGMEEQAESFCRVGFNNLLSFQRMVLPTRRIQKRCPWIFPSTLAQREEAAAGGASGKYSLFFGCGYSADVPGGVGNLDGGVAFTSCDYSRANCEDRGMFRADANSEPTRRFGGIEFLPLSTLVRSHGDKDFHLSSVTPNESKYNDAVPLIYGTGWYTPPVVFANNDGNLTRMEVLLGSGEMQGVRKVLVNQIEIPIAEPSKDMTATGWFEVLSNGARTGAFNPDFQDATGAPLGDPYGSMAYLSVVVPNKFVSGSRLPNVEVLADGVKLPRYDLDGQYLGEFFTNNPAWITLDVLRRVGWQLDDLNVISFAKAAQHCEELIEAQDESGGTVMLQRYRCNLMLLKRRSAAEVLRGIRNSAGLYLAYSADGKVALRVEGGLAGQQASKPEGSNADTQLNGGWPAYEFDEASIARRADSSASLSFYAKPSWETTNRLSIEFQDEFNLYQQDSVSIIDADDAARIGHEVAAAYPGLGVPNPNQAARLLRRRLQQSVAGNFYAEFDTSVRGVTLSPGDLITISYAKDGLDRVPFRIIRLAPDLNYRMIRVTAQLHDDAWYADSILPRSDGSGLSRANAGIPRPLLGPVTDGSGHSQFSIEEVVEDATDGSSLVHLHAGFIAPTAPARSRFAAPMLAITPEVETTGGTLQGEQSLYYAVTAVNAAGEESPLSISVRADLLATTNTNRVRLTSLSFPPGSTAFHVYRGADPQHLYRIASSVALAATYEDTGGSSLLIPAPDSNFDHANFYWRYELMPPVAVVTASENTIANPTLSLTANEFQGKLVRIVDGLGRGQERVIASHTATTLTVATNWVIEPDSTSSVVIAESTWSPAASVKTSPAILDVPNRHDLVVHVTGRAANAQNFESPAESAVVTRWRIGGGAGTGGGADLEAPPAPLFALAPSSSGNVELGAVSFPDLTNTHTIASGTVTLRFWNETAGPNTHALAASISDTDTQLDLAAPGVAAAGDYIQIEGEILRVESVLSGGTRYTLTRGTHGTTPSTHTATALVFHLSMKTFIVAFPLEFFGSPASGSYSYPFFLPGVRIGAAEMYVTNARGNSPTTRANYTGTTEYGLRIHTGSQYVLQVESYLAIQQKATPPVTISQTRAVRDIRARVGEAPIGAPITVKLLLDNAEYATITIPAGAPASSTLNGFNLPPLTAQSVLTMDITSVGQAFGTTPGRDLTVTVRV